MKIIDLLNKIANGEEVPKRIKYCLTNFKYDSYTNEYLSIEDETNNGNISIFKYIFTPNLNDEVEILEEEKKIPEKLPYYSLEKIQKAKNKDEWREERISLLEKRVNDLHIKMNDLLDYLKSKGDE